MNQERLTDQRKTKSWQITSCLESVSLPYNSQPARADPVFPSYFVYLIFRGHYPSFSMNSYTPFSPYSDFSLFDLPLIRLICCGSEALGYFIVINLYHFIFIWTNVKSLIIMNGRTLVCRVRQKYGVILLLNLMPRN